MRAVSFTAVLSSLPVAAAAGLYLTCSLAQAAAVSVPAPAPASNLSTPNRQALLGTISGRVTFDNGAPATGFKVGALPVGLYDNYSGDADRSKTPNVALTDADGRYSIHVVDWFPMGGFSSADTVPGKNYSGYQVWVNSGGQPYFEPSIPNIDLDHAPNHAVTGVDLILRCAPRITVYARDAITGAPTSGVSVQYGARGMGGKNAGVTDSSGALSFRAALTDIELQAAFPQNVGPAPSYGFGAQAYREFTAKPGQEIVWTIKTYSAGSGPDPSWHGTVLEPDGQPAQGVTVKIIREYGGGGGSAVTDADGRFSLRLPRLDNGESAGWSLAAIPVAFAAESDKSAAVAITPDMSWDGITLQLEQSGWLGGTLVTPGGKPAAYADVDIDGSVAGSIWTQNIVAPAVSDAKGRFGFAGLPPGSYRLHIHGGGYGNYDVPPEQAVDRLLPDSYFTALPLGLAGHFDLGRLVVQRADRALTGLVVDKNGKPSPPIFVRVSGAHTRQDAAIQPDGTFRVNDLVDEPLTVAVGVGTGNAALTSRIAPGQSKVEMVVSPKVIAFNGAGPQPAAPATPAPLPPIKVTPGTAYMTLDGLRLMVTPDQRGGFDAAVIRLNDLDGNSLFPLFLPDLSSLPASEIVWRGGLADVNGMRFAVKDDQGILTDSAGRALWSGTVIDAPDYVVTSTQIDSEKYKTTVSDASGRTLWDGKTSAHLNAVDFSGENLRILGLDKRVAWERGVGAARVAFRAFETRWGWTSDPLPVDAQITLRVVPAEVSVRDKAGTALWTGQAQTIVPAITAAARRGEPLLPVRPAILLGIMNRPAGATLTAVNAGTSPGSSQPG